MDVIAFASLVPPLIELIGPFPYWLLTPICIVSSAVAMTVGVGGAVFFTPIFILVLDLPPATAVATALMTQLFGFLSGTLAYWRRGVIDRRLARQLATVAMPAALAGGLIADLMPGSMLRRLFGGVALLVAYRTLATGAVPDPSGHEPPTFGDGRDRRWWEGPLVTGAGALLLGVISVGLAELQGFHLLARRRLAVATAVATNVVVVWLALVAAVSGHLARLLPGWGGTLDEVGALLVFTVPGVLVGGQLGPVIQARLQPATIRKAIGIILVAIGAVMLGVS